MRALLLLALCAIASCGREQKVERIEAAVERALHYLAERQQPDGSWRSAQYPALAGGAELTPFVLKLHLYAPPAPERLALVERARAFLSTLPTSELAYPVYTAALAAMALRDAPDPEAQAAHARWLALLRAQQLDERLGWRRDDLAHGGFGYAREALIRPPDGHGQPYDADLSSTLFALGALRHAGVAPDDPAVRDALRFVERCQNLPGDGGFFMTPSNAWQNKAGGAALGPDGVARYTSYGAMTADGLRALLTAGLAINDSRVQAARAWLVERFDPELQPGAFEPQREGERRASYYYWCWSVAHALFHAGERELDWARPLAAALLARQRIDGSFVNPFSSVMEDDPLVATPFAAAALALCARALRVE